MERRPYRDFDDKTQILPMITYENKWVSLSVPTLDLKLRQPGLSNSGCVHDMPTMVTIPVIPLT